MQTVGSANTSGLLDYPQYNFPEYISSEHNDHVQSLDFDNDKERSFVIANKVIDAINRGDLKEANEMVYKSYYLDPLCVDAWRMMIYILFHQHSDTDTVITATRELLLFSRRFYQSEFHQVGKFFTIQTTRPYIRILCDIAKVATHGCKIDVATYSYEEILRLNRQDDFNVHDHLLCCYLKIIGLSQRFPKSARPVRTIEHAKKLINCIFNENDEPFHLFEPNDIIVRWANLCFNYFESRKSGNNFDLWIKEVKNEHERNDLIFKLIFDEIQVELVYPTTPRIPRNLQVHNKATELKEKGGMIKDFLRCWPNMVFDLYKLFKGENIPNTFSTEVHKRDIIPQEEMFPGYKQHMIGIGENYLNTARKQMRNRQFEESFENLIHAKITYFEATPPSKRWYLHAPFAIASNLTTSSMHIGRWNFFRINLRFTLKMKPDHENSYLKLPKLADVYKAEQLAGEFQLIAQQVKDKKVKDNQQWKELADRVIGLTSITALAFAAVNKLTDEMKEELIKIGIEDCYTTINVGLVHPVLPWLTQDDLEQSIPNI